MVVLFFYFFWVFFYVARPVPGSEAEAAPKTSPAEVRMETWIPLAAEPVDVLDAAAGAAEEKGPLRSLSAVCPF